MERPQRKTKPSLEHLLVHLDVRSITIVTFLKFSWWTDGDVSKDLVPISKGVEVFTFDERAKIVNRPYQWKDEVPKTIRTDDRSE